MVGATGVFITAANTIETAQHLVDTHALHKRGDALEVAIAATRKNHITHDVIAVDFDFDKLTARALCFVDNPAVVHDYSGFMLV